MRVRRNLTQPVVAATLLAGLVLPQAEAAMAVPAPAPQPVVPEHIQAPVAVPVRPIVKKVTFQREAPSIRYRVKEGDCLWFIARAYLGRGREWRSIYAANRDQIRNPDLIYPGQVFTIPRRTGVVQSRHARQAEHRHRLRTAERLGEHQIAASELLRHSNQRTAQRLSPDGVQAPARAVALPPPNPELTRNSALVGDTFQGHKRVEGHFYRIQDGQLVWADDGKPVRGEWAKRLTRQVYPNQEAVQPQAVTAAPAEVAAPETSVEPSIQGHRRVNGTFFVMREGGLVWADDGTPVRAGGGTVMVTP
ncbi:MAG TPA: LysM peptidoglycan-binding domain-containing protein [Stenomitos sp.]